MQISVRRRKHYYTCLFIIWFWRSSDGWTKLLILNRCKAKENTKFWTRVGTKLRLCETLHDHLRILKMVSIVNSKIGHKYEPHISLSRLEASTNNVVGVIKNYRRSLCLIINGVFKCEVKYLDQFLPEERRKTLPFLNKKLWLKHIIGF